MPVFRLNYLTEWHCDKIFDCKICLIFALSDTNSITLFVCLLGNPPQQKHTDALMEQYLGCESDPMANKRLPSPPLGEEVGELMDRSLRHESVPVTS